MHIFYQKILAKPRGCETEFPVSWVFGVPLCCLNTVQSNASGTRHNSAPPT